MSSILFLFFNTFLIERYAKIKLKLQVGEFVDDIYLLTYEKSTEINCETLKKAHEICLQWAETHEATFASKKYELIHLTRSSEKFNMRVSVDLDSITTKSKASIRVLELQIDGKLRWEPHIREVKIKMKSQCRALSITAVSTWGVTLNKARQVYSSIVRSAIIYAAATWHTSRDLRDNKRSYVKTLETI